MKKLLITAIISIISGFCLTSCFNGSDKKTEKNDSIPVFCKADTTEVLQLTEKYLNHLKKKEFDAALGMLNEIRNDSVYSLPENKKQIIIKQQEVFPVLNYKLESYQFKDEHNVELTYSIEFFEKSEGSDLPNTIRVTFAPQRINAQWYLAVMEKSYIK